MKSKYIWALLVALIGVAAYGAVASATPPSGLSNPPWSPIIGRFAAGIDATAKTDINPGSARDFWRMQIQAKGATDVQILENLIRPGGTFGWHSHPGPSLVIVQSGTLSAYHSPDCIPEDFGPDVNTRIDIRRSGARPPRGPQQGHRRRRRLRRLVRPRRLPATNRRTEPKPQHLP